MLQEFKDFIMKGNLIDLAIAVVLATFFAPVVSSIVDGVVLNLLAAIVGKPSFDDVARIKISDGDPVSVDEVSGELTGGPTYLEFGKVITALVTFVIVGLVCFLIVKAYNKLTNKVEEEAGPSEVDLLTQIRDSLANR
jgi:large conductance mechanosensitive channel